MPLSDFHHVVMNVNIMNVKRIPKTHGGEAMAFRRCKRKASSIPNFLPSLLCYAIVILLLVVEPMVAFTVPRTSVGLGLGRHRIHGNHTSDDNILGASSRSIDESKDNEGGATQAHNALFSPLRDACSWNEQVRKAYRKRTNADPSFFGKSVTEVLVAAGTQLMAEWNRRGASRMISELDFVVPAVLTAVFGKYYRYV